MKLQNLAVLMVALAGISGTRSFAADEGRVRSFFPAARLIDVCSHDNDDTLTAQCIGYLSAVADTEMQRLEFTGRAYFCRPSGFTIGQLRDIVVGYARAHPERLDISAANLVTFAWQGAFPCPASKASP